MIRAALSWWCAQRGQLAALMMLAAGLVTFYGYTWVPEPLQAEAWNMGGALGRLLLLLLVVLAYRSVPVSVAALWWCVEDAQVVGCGLLWMLWPWPSEGGDRCSERFGLPLGLVGLALCSVCVWVLARHQRHTTPKGDRHDPAA